MRKKYTIIFFSFFLFFIYSCSEEDKVAPELTLSKEEVSFSSENSSATIALKSNANWTIQSSEPWCSVSQLSGEPGTKQLEVSVTENGWSQKRVAKLTVSADALSKQITINQDLKAALSITATQYEVAASESEITITVSSSPADYTVKADDDWISLKSSSPDKKTLVFTIAENNSAISRTGTIQFTLRDQTRIASVKQLAKNGTVPADNTGMSSDAKTLAKKITLGWNLGNALEVPGNETGWGNPKTTQALINAVKAAGFNAIRIPCAWDSYIENATNYKIKDSWLARVKEVVDYCYNSNMYVIINIHWDGGWLENNPTYAKQESVNKKQKALWEQIAIYFRGYDEHLLFAGTNEVHYDYNKPTNEHITVQQSYNQTFVDAVRSTGGRNTYRNLIVQSYNTNIDYAADYLTLPSDPTSNRMMVEVHYYDPWDFAGDDKSSIYLWGEPYKALGSVSSWGQEGYAKAQFSKIKTKFVDKNYPVILGEYGAICRTSLSGSALQNHLNSRAYYLQYITEQAKNYGLVPFYWDNGVVGDKGFGLFNRAGNTIAHEQALNALKTGSEQGEYPY